MPVASPVYPDIYLVVLSFFNKPLIASTLSTNFLTALARSLAKVLSFGLVASGGSRTLIAAKSPETFVLSEKYGLASSHRAFNSWNTLSPLKMPPPSLHFESYSTFSNLNSAFHLASSPAFSYSSYLSQWALIALDATFILPNESLMSFDSPTLVSKPIAVEASPDAVVPLPIAVESSPDAVVL